MNDFQTLLDTPELRHDIHVSDDREHPDCAKCKALRELRMEAVERRARHTPECPSRWQEYSEADCECGANIQIRTAAFWHGAGIPSTQIELTSGPAAQGVILALADGRLVQIADLGGGPRVQVIGPDAEVLADWRLPTASQGDEPVGGIEQYQAEGR